MRRENKVTKTEWQLIVDCPFNGTKDNFSKSGIALNGICPFASDPANPDIYVAKFISHSNRLTISTADFSQADVNACMVELDFYVISAASYNNIIDTANSGSIGIFTQYESPNWFFAIENVSEAGSGTSGQRLRIHNSQLPFGNWYHLVMSKYNGVEFVEVSDSNGNVIGTLTKEGLSDAPSVNQFSIGSGNTFLRPLNGYIKNFKLYKHI